jgi:transposase InsO family protein
MTKTEQQLMTGKWLLVVKEYELIRQKKSKSFTTVEQLCQVFKVHRKDIRKYYERWVKSGQSEESLLPLKRGPRPGQLKVLSKEEERTIIKIRRRLRANEFEISHMVEGKFRVDPSVSTIYRTFKRYPLNDRRKKAIKRYVKRYPGELLHADTYQLPKTLMIDRVKYYLLGVLDDHTRLCHTEIISAQTAAEVTRAYFKCHKWMEAHGIAPEAVMTDNGVEFTCYTSQKAKETHFFETMLKIINVKHVYTRPYHPQVNGKIERFWRILHEECILCQTTTLTKQQFLEELEAFMWRYNYQRRHSALNYKTPLDQLKNIQSLLPLL